MESTVGSMLLKELHSLKEELSEMKLISKRQNELLEKITGESNQNQVNIYDHSLDGLDGKISNLLRELKIQPNLKGYLFLREAIKLVYSDFNLLNRITCRLYPKIAQKFNTTPSKVERAIRFAIETSWGQHNKHFIYATNFSDSKPTNSQLIAFVADKFRIEKEAI